MKEISKTTLAGVAMLIIVGVLMAMLFMGKLSVQETAIALGILLAQTISAIGHLYAQDAAAPRLIQSTELIPSKDGSPDLIVSKVTPAEHDMKEGS